MAGHGRPVDQSGGDHGFGVLLLGVVQEPGVGDPREWCDGGLSLPKGALGLGQVGRDLHGPLAMDGANGAPGGPDHPPTVRQSGLPGGVRLGQFAGSELDAAGELRLPGSTIGVTNWRPGAGSGRRIPPCPSRKTGGGRDGLVTGIKVSLSSRSAAKFRARTSNAT